MSSQRKWKNVQRYPCQVEACMKCYNFTKHDTNMKHNEPMCYWGEGTKVKVTGS